MNEFHPDWGISNVAELGEWLIVLTNKGHMLALNGKKGEVDWVDNWMHDHGSPENQEYRIVIDNEDEELDEDTVMMDALDAGAADFEADEESFTVYTAEDDVAAVSDALTAKGYTLLSAQVEMLPQNGYIKLSSEDEAKGLQKMLDLLEDNDDVQNVWHNWEDAE